MTDSNIRHWEVTFRILIDVRWQDDCFAVEGGDADMAMDNARRKIRARYGAYPCYKAMVAREVLS